MTPDVKSALEGVAGRALTAQEEAGIDALLPARNDVAIATLLSAGRTRPFVREIGNGTILEVLGITVGNALLDELTTNTTHVKPLLDQGRLRIDSTLVQMTIQSFTQGSQPILTQAQADALCALGKSADPIHFNTISDALNVAEGRMTL